MDAEGWALRTERNLEQNVSVKIYFESPRCHTSMRILHYVTTEASWTKHDKKSGVRLVSCWNAGNFTFEFERQVWHSWSRAPKFSRLCSVGPRLVKMLPLTSWDSPTILFWLVQVLHRPIAIGQSASSVLGIQEPTFHRKLSQHPVLPGCVGGHGPNIWSWGTTKSVLSPEYCRHIWKVASMAVFDLEGGEL